MSKDNSSDKAQSDHNKGQEDGSKSGFFGELAWVFDYTKSSDYDKGFENGTKNRKG